LRATAAELVQQFGLDFILADDGVGIGPPARRAVAHRAHMRVRADLRGRRMVSSSCASLISRICASSGAQIAQLGRTFDAVARTAAHAGQPAVTRCASPSSVPNTNHTAAGWPVAGPSPDRARRHRPLRPRPALPRRRPRPGGVLPRSRTPDSSAGSPAPSGRAHAPRAMRQARRSR